MGALVKEDNLLKLVHPGGFVEVHNRPVPASQVMAKNPRHCVTRPDVFKFPWIVVRPESLLKPGNVFFIVPYHTLHGLLRGSTKLPHNPFDCHHHHERLRPMVVDPWRDAKVERLEGGNSPSTDIKEEYCLASSFFSDVSLAPPKSCLKKPANGRSKSRGRRVAFASPPKENSEREVF